MPTPRKNSGVHKKFLGVFRETRLQGRQKIKEFSYENMDVLVGKWLMIVRKEGDIEYEPDSLTSLHRGLDRYLQENEYSKILLKDNEFETSSLWLGKNS